MTKSKQSSKFKVQITKLGIVLQSFFILIFEIWILAFSVNEVLAQSLSLAVSPPLIEVLIKPGKTVTQTIKLTNRGETTSVNPSLIIYDSSGIRLGTSEEALIPWLSFIEGKTTFGQPFILKGGETREMKLKISPPKDLPDQEFYRVLLFSTSPYPFSDQSQSQISEGLGTVLLLTVTEAVELKKSAQIVRFDVPIIHDSLTPFAATIFVHNNGTTYFRPNGTITLEGMSGKAEFVLTPSVILSGQTKQLTVENLKGNHQTLFLPGLFFGKYRLTANFRLDEGTISVSETKEFYALPWKLTFIIVLSVLTIIAGIKLRRRRKRHTKTEYPIKKGHSLK